MPVQHAAGEAVASLPDPSGGLLLCSLDADGSAEFWNAVDRGRLSLRVLR